MVLQPKVEAVPYASIEFRFNPLSRLMVLQLTPLSIPSRTAQTRGVGNVGCYMDKLWQKKRLKMAFFASTTVRNVCAIHKHVGNWQFAPLLSQKYGFSSSLPKPTSLNVCILPHRILAASLNWPPAAQRRPSSSSPPGQCKHQLAFTHPRHIHWVSCREAA